MSTRLFDHAANSPTLHVQETIAALFGGSQEPLMLLVENATEVQMIQDLYCLQPTLTAMVQEGLLAAVASPAMLYPTHTLWPSMGALACRTPCKSPAWRSS